MYNFKTHPSETVSKKHMRNFADIIENCYGWINICMFKQNLEFRTVLLKSKFCSLKQWGLFNIKQILVSKKNFTLSLLYGTCTLCTGFTAFSTIEHGYCYSYLY